MRRPNIVFYFSDQQRWDTMGCYGQALPVTPHLDALAAEGTLFANAFTCQPVCGPARACLQTGLYATETGCFRNDVELPSGVPTLADAFHGAGYDTAYVGKWHLASNRDKGLAYWTSAVPPERRGGYRDFWMASDTLEFTSHGYDGYVFDGEGRRRDFVGYRADCINDYAIHFLHHRRTDRPFFLFLSQLEPHHQNDRARYEGPDGSRERFGGFALPGDLRDMADVWKENYADYLGQCHSLDANVARLVDTLKEQGVWDDTVLVYTSDHGSHFATRNDEFKRSCHDGCLHVPLVVHGPGFGGGRRVDDLVSLVDLPPTLLDCAGIPVPPSFQGRSLRPLASGGVPDWRQEVFVQISESQVGRALRTPRWKYSVRAVADGGRDSAADVYYEDFLYDLQADPDEQANLAADPGLADVRAQLAVRLKRRMVEAGEAEPEILEWGARG